MTGIDILISSVLALIMFGIGASIDFSSFKETFRKPKALITGLSLQMYYLPALFFTTLIFIPLSPELKVGVFIISLCPGGTTSNFISYLIGADVALSISMTSINSLLILITIPLLTDLSLNYFMGSHVTVELSFWDTASQVFITLIIPAMLGVYLRHRYKDLAEKVQKPLKYINSILLGSVFAIKFFGGQQSGGSGITWDEIWALLPITLGLHLFAMISSYSISKLIKIDNFKSTTISIEVGLQNTALALMITGTIIKSNEMTKPALVYAMFSFFTTLIMATLFRYGRLKMSKLQP